MVLSSVFRATARAFVRNHVYTNPCHAGPSRAALATFHSTAFNLAKVQQEVKESGRPRNKDIPYRVVRLVNPQTSTLDPPADLSDILQTIDQKEEWLELVATHPEPVVKIIKSSDQYNKKKAQVEKKREKRQRDEKEVQMTWGISQADLEHKLKKVREELERGNRVDLVYAPKKDQAQPTSQEMEARLVETVDLLADVGKEWKPREMSKTTAIIYIQGHNLPPPLQKRPPKPPQRSSKGKPKTIFPLPLIP